MTTERVAQLHRAQGRLTLDDLIGLLHAELAEAGEDFDALTAELLGGGAADPVRRLREQLAAVDDPRIGRRVSQQTAHCRPVRVAAVGRGRCWARPTKGGYGVIPVRRSAWPRP
ncbi:hypothetical protein [Streptomyces niveus]|uniref:hypothetical protein n=1 Tax=Streptomyces niveus TaxID=193462 RepID=UPI0036A5C096